MDNTTAITRGTRPTPGYLVVAIGLAGGLLSGLFGVGGGVIFVPALVALLGLPQRRAQGTSLAVILPTAMAGLLTYAHTRPIDVQLAVPTAVGAVVLAVASASQVHRVPAYQLKIVFFVLVIASAAKLFFG